jgi:hypothetical protein
MKLRVLAFLSCLYVFCSCNSSNTNAVSNNNSSYTAPDDAAIKKAVDDAYASLNVMDGEKPHYDSIKEYFIPQAQLINFIEDTAQILSIDNFVRAFKNYIESTKIQSYKEQESYGRTDQFGNIAQRISSYKTYINSLDIVKERGVNSFQLIKTPQGWKVSSIIWDVEKSGKPIPDYYLGKK